MLAIAMASLTATPWLDRAEHPLYDARLAIRGERPPHPDVVVVAVSSDTTADWWEPQAFWG